MSAEKVVKLGLGHYLLPPTAIISKMSDICGQTDKLRAASIVGELAKQMKAPLAFQMAKTIEDECWTNINQLGVSVTLGVVGTGISAGIAPGGVAFSSVPGFSCSTPGTSLLQGLPALALPGAAPNFTNHSMIQGIANQAMSIVSKQAASKVNLGYVASKLMNPALYSAGVSALLQEAARGQSTDGEFIMPIFVVRRDRPKSAREAPHGGRDRIYSLYERTGVIPLITYLSATADKGTPWTSAS